MRKLFFYPKLALGNILRNRSTYFPYILACIVSIFTVYTMVAINANGSLEGVRGQIYVQSFALLGAIILSIFCSVMIFYTNSFLAKQRKKELGLFSILGMEKKNIAILMFFETFFVAIISILLGLFLGALLSQLLFWFMLRAIQIPTMLTMPISFSAMGITALIFGFVFLLTLVTNILQVRLVNPIDLMKGAKQGEKEPKASWLLTVIGLLSIGAAYVGAVIIKEPIEAIALFFLLVLLVIVGTYCLFTSGSIALLKLMRKNKKYYYKPKNFISISSMIYRMKQNATGLATICILSCMVLVTVSATVSLNFGAEDLVQTLIPYEYNFTTSNENSEETISDIEDLLDNHNLEIAQNLKYRNINAFYVESENGYSTDNTAESNKSVIIIFILLDDYNKNLSTDVMLADNEVLLLSNGGKHVGEDTIAINGQIFRVNPIDSFGKSTAKSKDVIKSFTLVLANENVLNNIFSENGTNADYPIISDKMSVSFMFDVIGEESAKQNFTKDFVAMLETNPSVYFETQQQAKEEWMQINGSFLFFGLYFSLLFVFATALIIYYKQLSEGYDDAERFNILQKVGMSDTEVKKTINKQILTVFFLPFVTSIIHLAFAFFPVSNIMSVFGLTNIPLLITVTVLTALVYFAVYLLLFRITSKTYFRIVRRK